MGIGNFFSEVVAGRGMDAISKESNRVAGVASKEVNRLGDKAHGVLRLGEKVAGDVAKFGDKVAHTAEQIQNFTAPIALATGAIPVVGNIASGINSAVGAVGAGASTISDVARHSQGVIKTGDKIIRSGRNVLEARSGADLVSTARDISRAGRDQYKSSKSLIKEINKKR
jgi:hypothetical protein